MPVERDPPWIFRTYAGHSTAAESNRLYRANLAKGQTGLSVAFDLPTQTGYDADHPLAKGEVGKVGVPISHLGDMRALFEGIPLDDHEHLDDDQRDGRLAAGALCGARRRAGRAARQAAGHDPERHHQGISLARHLRVSAGALDAAHQGHRAVRRRRNAEMESDERLLLSPAGSRRDAGAGARLRARHRDRRARHRAGVRPGEGRGVRGGGRPHLLLRQCRHPLRHRALQDARLHRAVGRDHPRALRREEREAPPLPLRRAGELARAHRAAAREQRASHSARDALGRAFEERARARRAAAGLERGARPAPALGPAMVDPHAADRGLRDRPARIRRPVRRLAGDRRQGRGAEARGHGGAVAHRAHGRRHRRGRERLHEVAARGIQHQAARGDRARRADRGRRQPLHRGRAFAALGRQRADPDDFRRRRARADRAAATRGAPGAMRGRSRRRSPS